MAMRMAAGGSRRASRRPCPDRRAYRRDRLVAAGRRVLGTLAPQVPRARSVRDRQRGILLCEMPIYEYLCQNGHRFDVLQKMTDDPVSTCQDCGAPVQRVLHPVAIHFKGSGFYTTDYGRGKAAKVDGKEAAASASSSGSDASSSSSSSSNGSASGSSSSSSSTAGSSAKSD